MQRHIWWNASETRWDTHQWTLEDEDRTCERNAMDPREVRGSACRSARDVRTRNARKRENAKPARYTSARIANCVGTRDVPNSWDARKREESETRNAWDAKCARYAKRETRENAKCEKCDVRDMCENAKCAKIAKVAALQQVQYKVLLYGLYAPIETWVSTAGNLDGVPSTW